MSNDFKDLQRKWEDGKKTADLLSINFDTLYRKIKNKEKENYFFYYGTITILLTILIVITLFFYYVAPVKEILSRIGVGLMILGLVFRIFIEVMSIYKAKQINRLNNALETLNNTIKFIQFRKTIHNIIAPVVVVLYTIGFYMITPEFSIYIKFWNLVLIDVSYVIIGIILFFIIRKSVIKEMRKLKDIMELKKEIME